MVLVSASCWVSTQLGVGAFSKFWQMLKRKLGIGRERRRIRSVSGAIGEDIAVGVVTGLIDELGKIKFDLTVSVGVGITATHGLGESNGQKAEENENSLHG